MSAQQISVSEAKGLLLQESAILIDIRDEVSYAIAHVEQAINLTFAQLDDFVAVTDKSIPIVVLCYHGISSLQLGEGLFSEGFEKVYSVEGGYDEWKNHS